VANRLSWQQAVGPRTARRPQKIVASDSPRSVMFGPEEYLIHRAPNGTFEIRANIFASDQLSPNGAQRVSAHIIRDFGRATERDEVVDIELLPTDTTRERRVGIVRFGGPDPRPSRRN